MGRSGLTTILFLLMAILIVAVTLSGGPETMRAWWARFVGSEQDIRIVDEPPGVRSLNPDEGLRHVEGAKREMEAMDSLARSIRP